MAIDWRVWMYGRLTSPEAQDAFSIYEVDDVYGGGVLEGTVPAPFVIITMDPAVPGPWPGSRLTRANVSVHDRPGAYDTIDALLRAAEGLLVGQVALPGAIGCAWAGDTQDLAEEALGTILRRSTYTLTEGPVTT